MQDYYEKSMRALQLAGMSKRTRQCYTRSVRQIVDFYNKTPDLISEVELEDYFLHRQNKNQWSAATMRIAYCGIRFFFQNVLKREWHVFTYMNAKREKRLPQNTLDLLRRYWASHKNPKLKQCLQLSAPIVGERSSNSFPYCRFK